MTKSKPRSRDLLRRVREICLSLPETIEKEAWSTPTFRVKKKMFAMFMNNHHGDDRVALWLDAPPGDQEPLVAADPVRFFVPPYQGPFGWIGVRVDLDVDWDEVRELVVDAYRTSAPKTLLARLDSIEPVAARLPGQAGAAEETRRHRAVAISCP
jgi:hypothetical protein